MLIGVLSDTHGDFRRIQYCVPTLREADMLIHAGDFFEDAQHIGDLLRLRSIGVTGNCDYMVRGPSEEMLTLDNKRIYVTHGHLYRVKTELSSLIVRSKSLRAHVTVFGHTHTPTIFRKEGILFLNPGSLHSPASGATPSFAMLEIGRTGVKARIISAD